MDTHKLPHDAEAYLRKLRLGLAALPQEERNDILEEVRQGWEWARRDSAPRSVLA